MKPVLDISIAALVGIALIAVAAIAVSLTGTAPAMAEQPVAQVDAGSEVKVEQDLPAHRKDVRRVGPRFLPDPENALDLRAKR